MIIMAILKYANQSGVVYAYESISEWDPEKKQSRSKRRCLGRVDPDTGEIIPTSGKRGRPAKQKENIANGLESDDYMAAMEKLRKDNEEIRKQNQELIKENQKLKTVLSKIKKAVSDA